MKRLLFTKLSILIVIALVLQMHGYKGCLEKERTALLEIKELFLNSSVNIEYDRVNSILGSWVDDRVSDCCNWNRVECNTTTGRVINLSLFEILDYSSLSLSPILNFSMFQPFEELQSLNLSLNIFKGCVNSRESLKQLKILDLGGNNFNSSILPYLTTLTSLKTLMLGSNNLEDFNTKQDAGLENLRNLELLVLNNNQISGTLQELESLKQLKILDLGYNNFNSSILSYLTTLTSLKTLILKGNYLEDFNTKQGARLANLKNLEFLDLSSNGISGTLQELGITNLRNLEFLDLSNNGINGTLQEIGNIYYDFTSN
ncbi:hypothetical protein ACOSQ3_004048 [Xanthoceras sorbifolium]